MVKKILCTLYIQLSIDLLEKNSNEHMNTTIEYSVFYIFVKTKFFYNLATVSEKVYFSIQKQHLFCKLVYDVRVFFF